MCWRECGKKETPVHHWWDCKLVQPLWKTVWRFLKKLKIEPPYEPAILLLGMYPKNTNTNSKRYMHTYVHSSIIFFITAAFFFFIYFLFYLFLTALGLCSCARAFSGCGEGGSSSLQCVGFSLWWLLLLWSTGSRRAGFSSCGTQAQ